RGALRVLDALVRWYAERPQEDAGLGVALDHAQRLLRPGSRLLVLADPVSLGDIAPQRWSALSAHSDVVVLLLEDPLEREPPRGMLPFSAAGQRVDVDLGVTAQYQRWQREFAGRSEQVVMALQARGIRAMRLATDA